MRTRLAALAGLLVAVCSVGLGSSLPFTPSPQVHRILDGWRAAAISCSGPEVGWPGPGIQWHCGGTMAGVGLSILLDADRAGLESIVVDTPAADPAITRSAWTALLADSPALGAFGESASEWLQTTELRETSAPIGDGHVTIVKSGDGLSLYLVPRAYPAQPT